MKRVFRQILGWGMMLSLPLVMTSCGELFDMLDNPITPALQVLRAQLTLKVGESKPIQASTQAHVVLLYSSDNPAVATVDATGLITAVSPGTARITIKAQGEDDYYRTEIFSENTTTVEVTVTKKDGSITFATSNVIKSFGDDAFTNPLTIVGDGTVTYSSNNSNVATVDANGNVTIVDGGTAIISATTATTDNYVYKTTTAQYTLKIYRTIDLATVTSDFTANDNYILTGTLAGNYKISIAKDANVELKDVTINGVNNVAYRWAGLTCLDNANITITGTNSVKGFFENYPGIQAGPIGSTLTISGTGSLTATGGDYAAGIGSGRKATCGAITISGGTVNASSSKHGAGIGSGNTYSSCGAITISGGTVMASSGDWGAGIGSGFEGSSCGAITISGGTVNASSGQSGAGIGSGFKNSSCKNITISGGTIVATSTKDGAGIGSGFTNSSCGAITISGGTVIASSGDAGAGIGSGFDSTFGSITITAGITQVQATRNDSAAWPIGKGFVDPGSTGAVTINGVTVTNKDWDGTGLTDLNFATSSTGGNNLTWTLTSTTTP
ncbi:Ig-like domain (group 2) [Xylanibacter ruminicola]|uniref:Ig-like domain (Group 2) n=1 Tax=Xylanibacter ruminicola TaxID=839 RepID=A0A1M7CIU7_XYLRU|nr:Ig-like domain-containing protein [Xylanibacter ruminicola]SHL67124.1 Ig-like domain (group 2) [Xylanibacter ruminicola]